MAGGGLLLRPGRASRSADTDRPKLPHYRDHTKLLVVRDPEGREFAVGDAVDWSVRRAHILEHFQEVAGPVPGGERRVLVHIQEVERFERDGLRYRRIRYAAEPGNDVPAWVVEGIDDGRRRRRGILALHQTTRIGKDEPAGLGGSPALHYGSELAACGFLVVCPDYPGFGENVTDPYRLGYASATMKGIWNHSRALDVLQALLGDPRARLGVIGHSLGGHNGLFLGLFDERAAALVSSCGFNALAHYRGGQIAGWAHAGYLPRLRAEYGLDLGRVPFDFPELLGAWAPRPVFLNAPVADENFAVEGVRVCVEAARPVYRLYGAEAELVVHHPEAGHEFPAEVRRAAYRFLAERLGGFD